MEPAFYFGSRIGLSYGLTGTLHREKCIKVADCGQTQHQSPVAVRNPSIQGCLVRKGKHYEEEGGVLSGHLPELLVVYNIGVVSVDSPMGNVPVGLRGHRDNVHHCLLCLLNGREAVNVLLRHIGDCALIFLEVDQLRGLLARASPPVDARREVLFLAVLPQTQVGRGNPQRMSAERLLSYIVGGELYLGEGVVARSSADFEAQGLGRMGTSNEEEAHEVGEP